MISCEHSANLVIAANLHDPVAVAITKGNDLVALEMLVPAKSNVVAALLGHGRRVVTVHDGCIEQIPLAPQVEQAQDVVEFLVQGQLDVRPSTAAREVWQDKFIKLCKAQTRWNPLPVLAFGFRHFDRQSRRIFPDAAGLAQTAMFMRPGGHFQFLENPQPVVLLAPVTFAF